MSIVESIVVLAETMGTLHNNYNRLSSGQHLKRLSLLASSATNLCESKKHGHSLSL